MCHTVYAMINDKYTICGSAKVYKIPVKVQKKGQRVLFFDWDDLPFPANFNVKEKQVILFPPHHIGGNHRHPRREAFIALGNGMELHWIDHEGVTRIEKMQKDDHLYLFIVPSLIPHAIVNRCAQASATLLEFAEAPKEHVERVDVINQRSLV